MLGRIKWQKMDWKYFQGMITHAKESCITTLVRGLEIKEDLVVEGVQDDNYKQILVQDLLKAKEHEHIAIQGWGVKEVGSNPTVKVRPQNNSGGVEPSAGITDVSTKSRSTQGPAPSGSGRKKPGTSERMDQPPSMTSAPHTTGEKVLPRDLLVQIFIPDSNSGMNGRFAVGLPVAPDRILTSLNALLPAATKPSRIKIRWPHREEWQPITDIAWRGNGDVDAALLDCRFPLEMAGRHAKVSFDDLEEGMHWKSLAFPLNSSPTHSFEVTGEIGGPVGEMFETSISFPNNGNFGNLSGVPVFNGEGAVVGVIGSTGEDPLRSGFRRMMAMERLHRIPEFLESLYWHDEMRRKKRLDNVKREVATQLNNSKEASDYLDSELQSAGLNTGSLADRLLNLNVSSLIALLVNLYGEFVSSNPEAAKVGSHILCKVVPVRMPISDIRDVRRQMADPNMYIIIMNAGTETAAEFIMADAMERAASFRRTEGEKGYTLGRTGIPLPPESGWSEDPVDNFFHRLEDQLIKETLNPRDHEVIDREFEPGTMESRNRKLQLVEYFMSPSDPKEPITLRPIVWYHIFDASRVDEQFRMRLENMNKNYPSLLFISLSEKYDRLREDKKSFNIPVDMLVNCA
ncbi:MAG: hypothetical protein HQL52_19600 [Magnetococcales bacterium]|nr:hypothetical protein [Magnetococcales bacterium]